MNLVAPNAVFKAKLEVLNGPLKGRSFKLLADQILIGRSPEGNDIVLDQDPYCSRQHAVITKKANSDIYFVSKLTSKSFVWVNSKKIDDKKQLKNKDVLTVGKTQFRLQTLKEAKLVVAPSRLDTPQINHQMSSKKRSPSQVFPKIMMGLIVLGILYLIINPDDKNSKRKEFIQARTTADIETDIKNIKDLEEKSRKEKNKLKQNASYKNAQIAYLKGIRDYRKGFFGRARENFGVCKTLYPQHQLCSGYFKKAEMKYHQIAQKQLVLGKSYQEKKQYHHCVAAFKGVINMMKKYNKNHPLYREAKANLQFCQLHIAERY